MAQTTDEIRHEIETRRSALAQDINELEHRVKHSVNINEQFRRHRTTIFGAAFLGGLLFGFFTGQKKQEE